MNFHPRIDRSDGSDNFSALICGDAITTAQRCVRAEHAQDSLGSNETLLSIFNKAERRRIEASTQINETIASYADLARGTARLQPARQVHETSLIIVNPVREAPA